eukprot:gnl/TRDRNA2_/TRDRNA2_47074_c0_seq1.p1 gnl/TRDRNA2_/TRDRNA2_47074_c0~~gnl/TRDRNA2_/TRDRNA2_47074_c0_seq1.p1  ORF type:complete len:270 (+),score=55.34 gnl/TRDRNA2_/TRDRNA2_47074_c0_seq1:53-862(+)
MYECSACHVDYYHNADIRMLCTIVCDHRVCEPCVMRLFQHGRQYPCPACGKHLRAEDFSEQTLEDRRVCTETRIRREIGDIYSKTREDFPSTVDYDSFLEERENVMHRLVNPTSQEEVQDLWKRIDVYKEQNAEQILRERGLQPRKKLHRVQNIIDEEGLFSSHVNAEWVDRDDMEHPFQARYRRLLEAASPQRCRKGSGDGAQASPLVPQPLAGVDPGAAEVSPSPFSKPADKARQMSAGGQSPDLCLKKARHFFLADLLTARTAPNA